MNAIAAIDSVVSQILPAATASPTGGTSPPDFANLLGSGVAKLDNSIAGAEQTLAAVSLGANVSTQDVMIALEQARFSLQFAVEIRNRLVEGWTEMTRMQV